MDVMARNGEGLGKDILGGLTYRSGRPGLYSFIFFVFNFLCRVFFGLVSLLSNSMS